MTMIYLRKVLQATPSDLPWETACRGSQVCATNETDIITWRTMKPGSVNPTTRYGRRREGGKPETEISSIITPRDSAVGVAVHAPFNGSFGMNFYSEW